MTTREWYQLVIITKSGFHIRKRPASMKECFRLRDFYFSLYDCQYKIIDVEGKIYHEGNNKSKSTLGSQCTTQF